MTVTDSNEPEQRESQRSCVLAGGCRPVLERDADLRDRRVLLLSVFDVVIVLLLRSKFFGLACNGMRG